MKSETLYTLVATAVLALVAGPLGTAVFVLGFLHGDSPCVLCWAQRTAMALVALTALFILRFGPRPRYIGLGVLIAAHGLYMGMRHTSLHVGRDVGQGFSLEILGAHTYTWSLLVFWVAVVAIGALLMLTPDAAVRGERRALGPLGRAAGVLFMATAAANAVQAFASTGPPPFMGQSDPVRFSFDPRHWVWSLEEWQPAPISWRGRFDVGKPDLSGLERDPRRGPLGALPLLASRRRLQIAAPLDGAPTDLAYEPGSDRFLVTTDAHGVYLLDGTLARVVRRTVVDPGYSVDLGRLAGAAWLDAQTLVALGENKSFVVLRESDTASSARNFRFFLESFDQFDELRRGRFATVRAHMNYVLALGHDAGSGSLYTLSFPNRRYPQLVVSRFDTSDWTLSEEYLPRLAASSGLALAGEGRALGEYAVTGVAIAAGRLYAMSASYATLLVLDLATREIVAAYAIDGSARPTGLAIRGSELYVVDAPGEIVVVDRP